MRGCGSSTALAALVCCLALAGRALGSVSQYELLPYDSVADAAAVVHAGSARFTVLTDRLVRMEYAASGQFEDRPTLAFINRKVAVPAFTQHPSGAGVVITTASITLTYTGGAFSASSLTVTAANTTKGGFQPWAYGMTSDKDPWNLRGTFRTLDRTANVTLNCTANNMPHCEWGIISRCVGVCDAT
jgi:hypothetical protein